MAWWGWTGNGNGVVWSGVVFWGAAVVLVSVPVVRVSAAGGERVYETNAGVN